MAKVIEEGYRNFIRHTDAEAAYRQYRLNFHGSMVGGYDYDDYLAATMGPRSYMVGAELKMEPPCALLIGKYCSIADDVLFLANNDYDYTATAAYPLHLLDMGMTGKYMEKESSHSGKRQIIIGNDVRIGTRAIICAGVRIGNGAIVTAGAVVTEDVPPYAIVGGNPAKVIKYRFDEGTIKYLQKIKWWHWPETEIVKHKDFMLDPSRRKEDLPSIKVQASEEIARTLNGLRAGGRFFGVLVDSEHYLRGGEPLYRHVMESFLESAGTGDVLLLAAAPEHREEGQKALALISERKILNIRLIHMGSAFNYTFLTCLDYFLAGRQEADVTYVDYAEEAVTGVLMGADQNPFVGLGGSNRKNSSKKETEKALALPEDLAEKKRIIEAHIANQKNIIRKELDGRQYENAMQKMMGLASLLYNYNQEYTDDDLEGNLQELAKALPNENAWKESSDSVLFYDGFGLDTRGLATIYLDALSVLPCKIIYLVSETARGHIPTLEKKLSKAKEAEIVYYSSRSMLEAYRTICRAIDTYRPCNGFLYTTPYDIAGITCFMQYEGRMTRYQVNLTDHAFWLGRNALDWCLEARDYGASISVLNRKIDREKLLRVYNYPDIEVSVKFQGYPFERNPDDFVIFSGGSLYKTIDKDLKFYKIVDHCLKKYVNVKFWYAGRGDDRYLKEFMRRYPGRVFHTMERQDLFALLKNVDMFLNTYPFAGGLMTQYSAAAGRIPITLKHFEDSSGFLPYQGDRKIEFDTVEELEQEIGKIIEKPAYRKMVEDGIEKSASNKDEFRSRIKEILLNPRTSQFEVHDVDTCEFRRGYLERYKIR